MTQPIMQFVTVQPFEVRVEIMVKCKALIPLIQFALQNQKTIQTHEQASLFQEATAYFKRSFKLLKTGFAVEPSEINANFLRIGDEKSVIRKEIKDEPLDSAVLGVSMIYEHAEVPDYFQLTWPSFPQGFSTIPGRIRVQESEQGFEFSPYVTQIDWANEGIDFELPKIQPIPAQANWLGTPQLDKETVHAVFEGLISNVYDAFRYTQEIPAYEMLSLSVTDSELAEIYLQHRRILDTAQQGGPVVEIQNIDVRRVTDLERKGKGFRMIAEWTVSGVVTHFGHTHKRQNLYRAKVDLVDVAGYWKFSRIELLEENRIQ